MSREVEDVSIVNKQRLALAAVFKSVRDSGPKPTPGPFLRFDEDGAVTTNKGKTVREGRPKTR